MLCRGMLVAHKYRLVATSLRQRAAMPEIAQHRARLLVLAEQFDQIAVDADKEAWNDIDTPPNARPNVCDMRDRAVGLVVRSDSVATL
jgi:hypothetical protein